jgi:hypothetical protein
MVVNINTVAIYQGILTLENEGTEVNYCGIFITLALGANVLKQHSDKLLKYLLYLEAKHCSILPWYLISWDLHYHHYVL